MIINHNKSKMILFLLLITNTYSKCVNMNFENLPDPFPGKSLADESEIYKKGYDFNQNAYYLYCDNKYPGCESMPSKIVGTNNDPSEPFIIFRDSPFKVESFKAAGLQNSANIYCKGYLNNKMRYRFWHSVTTDVKIFTNDGWVYDHPIDKFECEASVPFILDDIQLCDAWWDEYGLIIYTVGAVLLAIILGCTACFHKVCCSCNCCCKKEVIAAPAAHEPKNIEDPGQNEGDVRMEVVTN